jgi:hypothetical protein
MKSQFVFEKFDLAQIAGGSAQCPFWVISVRFTPKAAIELGGSVCFVPKAGGR